MPPIEPPQEPEAWVLGYALTIVLVLLGLIAALFWVWTLWRIVRSPVLSDVQRIAWFLVVLLLPVIGMILYALFRPKATIEGPMQGT